ncbi:thiamine phosphate synthase [Sphaerobacter sp.]|uniref:thiamine phosphate synthase n=1 Tax=Sphaerobacter sp. TaxID=2099654 RepID=UPI001D1C639E|nr:thiamine phosphate synthase [Sphaerobacter sp.]MBX5444272.1 thiamine phosphate synthase [Sphaerobacter sp.]
MSRTVPRLHLISDRRHCPLDRFPEVARAAVLAGFDAVHLREKDLPAAEVIEAARALNRAIGDEAGLLINDRVDVALIVGAAGVQLGETSLSPRDVRALAGQSLLIGRSVHDVEGAERAAVEGADFVIAGHVYATGSKPGQPPRGLDFLAAIVAATPLPVIAVGGITPDRVPEVIAAGAHGVAVISGVLAADDPGEAAAAYHRALVAGGSVQG